MVDGTSRVRAGAETKGWAENGPRERMMDDEGMIEFGEEQPQLQAETGMAAALVLLVDTLERHNALPKDEYASVLSKILEHPDVPLDTPHTRFLAQVHELLTERPRPELTLVSNRDGRSHS